MNLRKERKKRIAKWGVIIVLVLFIKKCISKQNLHKERGKL